MSATRTTISDAKESGYRFIVTADRDSIVGLADELMEELRGAAEINMMEAQDFVVREVKQTLGFPGEGPAPPNEPPRFHEGTLYDSWKRGARSWRNGKTVLRGAVESKHPAAGALEFGALRNMGIRPHPYYRPTLARIADELGHLLTGGV